MKINMPTKATIKANTVGRARFAAGSSKNLLKQHYFRL
jgi:hypothetical protein